MAKMGVWGGWEKTPQTCRLQEVMSEQLANQIEESELQKALDESILLNLGTNPQENDDCKKESEQNTIEQNMRLGSPEDETWNDFLIAQMMQADMLAEAEEEEWKIMEAKNGNSKVKLLKERMFFHEDEEDEEEEDLNHELDEYFKNNPESKVGDRRGCSGRVTKHNMLVSSRRNASRMEKLPPNLATGNSMSFDMRLNNTVYNGLKVASIQESKRAHRHHEKKEHATKSVAMDDATKVSLMKLIGTGVVAEVGGLVALGKEAAVFSALGGASAEVLVPPEVAIKIFRKFSAFKTKGEYMREDIKMKRGHASKLIKEWVEKEEQNLRRMNKNGIPCPQPIIKKNNMLVLTFIGRDQVPAPRIKDAHLSEDEKQNAFKQTVKIMVDMYNKCNLVHSDLSQYNLLWFEGVVYVIDVAQAVFSSHPKAHEYLMRDCINVIEFFQPATTWQELFGQVTGICMDSDKLEFAAKLQIMAQDREVLQSKVDNVNFEHLFNLCTIENSSANE